MTDPETEKAPIRPAVESEPVNPEFEQTYADALVEFDELIELHGGNAMSADPETVGMEDDRDFGQLSVAEIEVILALLCARYGVDLSDPDSHHRTYTTEAPEEAGVPGALTVDVYRSSTEHFLHRLTYSDGSVSYLVGPDEDFDAAD